ncbi:2OG-Fe(II) oxygenase superfamily protein [Colletotrichum asianum]|uniref:2OG-Fe(II) oxygenase superfamily protein n=1 Tax=Colletotrichum asianum TaxID=702518 RepID=A0A8H3WPL4_9PEZI|nr:2OG-Fe(II) oxygenase superfamily protein [Colletotrichum asianum]
MESPSPVAFIQSRLRSTPPPSKYPAHAVAHQYETQIVSQDPLIIYIHDFLNQDEISHVLAASEGRFEPSKVYNGPEHFVDPKTRISESTILQPDIITRRIKRRATSFRGWRNNSTFIEDLKVQRYGFNGYYSFHYDWDKMTLKGNRVATFMVYLTDSCTGGGTNFPRVDKPVDQRWCGIIDCEETEYEGATFKLVAGSAVYWENMHANGSFHHGVRHASLPVKSGEKGGLNIWFWDMDWRPFEQSV